MCVISGVVCCCQIEEFRLQKLDLDEKLSQKTHEVEVLQTELKLVKEFRKKRAHMQKELDEVGRTCFTSAVQKYLK